MPETDEPQNCVCGRQKKAAACILGMFFILGVAQLTVGGLYENDCPREPFIPTYLYGPMAVIGILGTIGVCNKICFLLTSIFFIGWFIAGNVAIFSIYEPNYNKNTTKTDSYCNKTLYLFAFWGIILTYVLFAALVYICCCCKEKKADDNEALLQR
ncbi:transmembrane protein 272-like [Neolamprologus brichardi]|uniref:transmembrane protein 272-like n=1 Tax=Neolamprologus brichardi TaxID=32507 RepID=UPI0016438136|nr:transmembrane protein 272-like [Neolamprologus brichardi]